MIFHQFMIPYKLEWQIKNIFYLKVKYRFNQFWTGRHYRWLILLRFRFKSLHVCFFIWLACFHEVHLLYCLQEVLITSERRHSLIHSKVGSEFCSHSTSWNYSCSEQIALTHTWAIVLLLIHACRSLSLFVSSASYPRKGTKRGKRNFHFL